MKWRSSRQLVSLASRNGSLKRPCWNVLWRACLPPVNQALHPPGIFFFVVDCIATGPLLPEHRWGVFRWSIRGGLFRCCRLLRRWEGYVFRGGSFFYNQSQSLMGRTATKTLLLPVFAMSVTLKLALWKPSLVFWGHIKVVYCQKQSKGISMFEIFCRETGGKVARLGILFFTRKDFHVSIIKYIVLLVFNRTMGIKFSLIA